MLLLVGEMNERTMRRLTKRLLDGDLNWVVVDLTKRRLPWSPGSQ